MAFSLSGTQDTIIQTGIDNDLAGLAALAGVNTVFLDNGQTVYEISRQLRVDGDLSFNPNTEKIIFADSIGINELIINGSLHIDNPDSHKKVWGMEFMRENSDGTWNQNEANIRVNNNGNMSLTNSEVKIKSPINLPSANSDIESDNGKITANRSDGSVLSIRSWATTGWNVSSITLHRISISMFRTPQRIENPLLIGSSIIAEGANKVKFKYEKGDGETGDPIVTEDDYALSNSGIANEFTSFASETGQLIQSQTTTLSNLISDLETKIDSAAKESTLSSVSTKVTDIFDGTFGSAVYDKANSVVNLFRGKDTSEPPFASFDIRDENGAAAALNRFFSRIKK